MVRFLWPVGDHINGVPLYNLRVQVGLQWMKYFFFLFFIKNVTFYLYDIACDTQLLKILLNKFILFFMFVHRKIIIIKLPSGEEEYQLIKL